MQGLCLRAQAEQEEEGWERAEGKGDEEEAELRTSTRRLTADVALGQSFVHTNTLSACSNPVRQVSVNPFRGKETGLPGMK